MPRYKPLARHLRATTNRFKPADDRKAPALPSLDMAKHSLRIHPELLRGHRGPSGTLRNRVESADSLHAHVKPPKPFHNTFEDVFQARKAARSQARDLSAKALRRRVARLTKRYNALKAPDQGPGYFKPGVSATELSRIRARLTGFRNELTHDLLGNVKAKSQRERAAALQARLGKRYSRFYGFQSKAVKPQDVATAYHRRKRDQKQKG